MLKLGRNVLLNNNVLVLKFNNYGILEEKLFYDKNKMNEYKFAEAKTENEVKRGSFLQSFLTSLRNKMYSNAGKSKNAYKTIGEAAKEIGLIDKKKNKINTIYFKILGKEL